MKQLKVKPTWLKATKALSDAECGRLFRGALKYAFSGEAPVLTGNERIVWEQVMDEVDQQRKRSDHQSEVNLRNVTNRYESLRIVTNRSEEKEVPSSPPEPPVITPKKESKKTLSKERAKESLLSPALQDAVNAFKEMRQKMRKPMTPLAVDLMVDKLRKLAPGDDQKQVAMLMQSIENGWTGVYELKADQVRGNKKTAPHTFFNYKEKGECVDLKSIEATLDTDFGGPPEGLVRSRKNNTLLNYNETQAEVKPIELNLEEL